MAKAVILSNYLPHTLRNLKEFQEIDKAETPELVALLEAVDKTLNNMYIETADEDGIARFEKILSIYPADDDTLDVRRFRVQTKWNDQLPYTEEELRGRLATLCGKDGYSINVSYEDYSMEVKVALVNKEILPLVSELLNNMVPCNMVITLMLKYNTYGWLTGYTHEQLSAYTYDSIRNFSTE